MYLLRSLDPSMIIRKAIFRKRGSRPANGLEYTPHFKSYISNLSLKFN
jgi:hypothetical protein